jgi:hypothetical protein
MQYIQILLLNDAWMSYCSIIYFTGFGFKGTILKIHFRISISCFFSSELLFLPCFWNQKSSLQKRNQNEEKETVNKWIVIIFQLNFQVITLTEIIFNFNVLLISFIANGIINLKINWATHFHFIMLSICSCLGERYADDLIRLHVFCIFRKFSVFFIAFFPSNKFCFRESSNESWRVNENTIFWWFHDLFYFKMNDKQKTLCK